MKNYMIRLVFLGLVLGGLVNVGYTEVYAQMALTSVINSPTEGQTVLVNQPLTFSGSATGGNPTFYGYLWNFGDGTFAGATNFSKTYNTAGPKTVSLTVTDFTGAQAITTRHIIVNPVVNPDAPTVDLMVNGGNGPLTVDTGASPTLTWTSTNATSCTASSAWSGSRELNGSESVGPLSTSGTFVYTLSCAGAGGSASDSVTVNVGTPGGPVTPVISNIQVTNVTQTGATITWDTNILADSRVIYDTVSHPTLGTAPNFGYAFTTDTLNVSPKVTAHSVSVTGLTPNTQYFFRVLSQS
ncbi:fibronectin type III domain-containing protein [Candidatus Nomurabacteria bacterium]|nr:fibronectin type III domain-containing protein [Candidatus Nomurabacteria bacterium]